jgi:hypothetical protein
MGCKNTRVADLIYQIDGNKGFRVELRSLRRQFNTSRDEGEKEGLRQLRDKKARTRSAFFANTFKFVSKILSEE